MTLYLTAALIGIAVGALGYFGTRLAIGSRADHMIASAGVLAAFFVPPWWISLAGAILGHVIAVKIMRLVKTSDQGDPS